jgi:hypothetical protein
MPVTEQEFQCFSEYVHERLANGGAESLSGLALEWEAHREAEETIDDVRQGLADIEAGLGKPAEEVFTEVRQRLGLAK